MPKAEAQDQSVGQAGYIVVPGGRDEHLGLVLQPSKSLGVNNPVPVPLEFSAQRTRRLQAFPAA